MESFDPRAHRSGCPAIWDLRAHTPGATLAPMDFDQPIHARFVTAY
jgi:hypothetical protein